MALGRNKQAFVGPPSLPDLDRAIGRGIADNIIESASCILVSPEGRNPAVVRHHQSYGNVMPPPPNRQSKLTTRYDLGQLSFALGTVPLAMALNGKGRLELQRKLGELLPFFKKSPAHDITVDMLLDQTSGLDCEPVLMARLIKALTPPRHFTAAPLRAHPILGLPTGPTLGPELAALGARSLRQEDDDVPQALMRNDAKVAEMQSMHKLVARFGAKHTPGSVQCVSWLNAWVLGWVLEQVGNAPLAQLMRQHVLVPMRMVGLLDFEPAEPKDPHVLIRGDYCMRPRCDWRQRDIIGEVEDKFAWSQGGAAGHAGLFANADAVMQMLLGLQLSLRGLSRYINPATVARFWARSKRLPQANFALGYQVPCRDNGMAPGRWHAASVGAIDAVAGHAMFIDPHHGLIGVFLSQPKVARDIAHDAPQRASWHALRLRVFDLMASLGQRFASVQGRT